MRYPRPDDDPERQGDLIILKRHDPATGEKGVILVSFTESVQRFAALFDLDAIASRYVLVFEPSWWGYQDHTFMMYLSSDLDVVIESPSRSDFDFIDGLGSNLVASRVGAGDWIDPDVFRPEESVRREYDLVMVSSWNPLKRHAELFQTLAGMRRGRGRSLRVALVGYPDGWTREDVERLARRHSVLDCITFFESIPHAEVARVVSRSRAYVLLSRREGANRALYEAIFCDTPVIVYRHHRGVNTDHVTGEVGVLFEDGRLEEAIAQLLDADSAPRPRAWGLEHTGFHNATRLLNESLRALAARRGSPWTTDIVEKKMAPALYYGRPGTYREFAEEYDRLATFLRA
jgi:glycosyltransferase involved in cell wall biosynthesis